MLKKSIFIAMMAGSLMASENFTTTVTNVSTRIAAAGTSQAVPVVVGMTAVQGSLYYSTNGLVYMAVGGGVVTNLPIHTTGDSVSVPVMRKYPASSVHVTSKRTVIYIDNRGTNRVWLTTGGGVAVSGTGIRLDPGERLWMGTWKSIEAITESGVSVVATQEVFERGDI